jgi:hypothetical protein
MFEPGRQRAEDELDACHSIAIVLTGGQGDYSIGRDMTWPERPKRTVSDRN